MPRVVWQHTFDGLRHEQIDEEWVARGGGLEAYVFDGRDLTGEEHWRALEESLRRARRLGVPKLTLHFPTDNADWVHDARSFAALRRFCDMAAVHQADGIVLHANQFVAQENWLSFDLAGARSRVTEKLAELDAYLGDAPLWVGIENLPVIGTQGVDYDSVFVHPEDFRVLLELGSRRLGVTWDVCHWAVTWTTAAAIAQLQRKALEMGPFDLPPLPVKHVHFGSFTGHAMPFWRGECFEGATPQRGEVDTALLSRMLRNTIDAAPEGVGVVFEVQETDYLRRQNCWETLDWVNSRSELSGLHEMREGPRG
ncbi:hypothetical protein BIV25_01165 [Streptomyces sp. MUSC 14]|nr:hypothetical protein BIV25_01165 [Streptomyces sp. MUSC 14]